MRVVPSSRGMTVDRVARVAGSVVGGRRRAGLLAWGEHDGLFDRGAGPATRECRKGCERRPRDARGARKRRQGDQRLRPGCWLGRGRRLLQDAFSWTRSGGMVDLGTLGGGESQADAVDTSGQVVGWAETNGYKHAFSWTQAGGMADIGTLGGAESIATGVSAWVKSSGGPTRVAATSTPSRGHGPAG